jgi:hypothetical protein
VAFFVAQSARGQSCNADIPQGKTLESTQYRIAYRTTPAPVAIGTHFRIEMIVCPRAGAVRPERVQVDARMPEHGHGMNYKALVKPVGGGRFHAEGLMFHMPGRWELVFDVNDAGERVRLTDSIVLR